MGHITEHDRTLASSRTSRENADACIRQWMKQRHRKGGPESEALIQALLEVFRLRIIDRQTLRSVGARQGRCRETIRLREQLIWRLLRHPAVRKIMAHSKEDDLPEFFYDRLMGDTSEFLYGLRRLGNPE